MQILPIDCLFPKDIRKISKNEIFEIGGEGRDDFFSDPVHLWFTSFGPVSRVFLAKNKINNTSKGFAFITFNDKIDG